MRRRARKGGGRQVELTVEEIGGRGDGYAKIDGRPLFVPLTVPGDRVRARVVSETAAGFRGELVELLSPGPARAEPPCPHFGACGGCALQMLEEAAYLAWKEAQIDKALSHAALSPLERLPMIPTPPRSRRRVSLAAQRRGREVIVGYRQRLSHSVVPIESCLLLQPALENLLAPLADVLRETGFAAGDIVATACENGVDLALGGLEAPDLELRERLAAFAEAQDLARLSLLDEDGGYEPLVVRRSPQVSFGGVPVTVPPGVFLQASKVGEEALTATITSELGGAAHHVAELFCGVGSFTFPLSRVGRVDAFEADEAALAAFDGAVRINGLTGRITTQRRDLYRQPLRASELAGYTAVVFDPPRAGAKDQAAQIAQSGVPLVVAVSCNPATFARDVRLLVDGGYRLVRVATLDQFLWSPHVELVGVLRLSGD